MRHRSPELTQFLSTLHQAIVSTTAIDSEAFRVTDTIMSALREPKTATATTACTLPVCGLLNDATNDVEGKPEVVQHAQALQALAPHLAWWQRAGAEKIGEPFASGHANATVVGPGGLEERDDVTIGISLLAPDITYPVHHHPPEEVYLVLSAGEWQQDNGHWHEPGVGGIVYNPADILHAMRSGSKPLLATWCLLTLTD